MKLLFVDHAFHQKTRSSNFFLELLRRNFRQVEVEHIDIDHDTEFEALHRALSHDLVVLWQVDFLAPAFLAAGYPTVVVPMYDGSANLPHEHWLAMSDASLVCFSRTLHERGLAAGCRSHLVKYFLPPCQEAQLPQFDNLRGFLWMRRPQDGITPKLAEILLGTQLASLHVHNAPDDGNPRLLSDPAYRATSFPITESRWRPTMNQYMSALKSANVFVAPRPAEGIGLTVLEAFAHGLLVLANDDAVHNEYVANWVNGIMFSRQTPAPFQLAAVDARDIARAGWCGAAAGYEEWLDMRAPLLEFLKATPPRPGARRTATLDAQFVVALMDAYLLGIDPYRHFLREHVITAMDHGKTIKRVAAPLRVLLDRDSGALPVLDAEGLFFGTSPNSVARKFGFGFFDAFSASLASSTVGFSMTHHEFAGSDGEASLGISCELERDLTESWSVLVYVNRVLCSRAPMPLKAGPFTIEAPLSKGRDGQVEVMLSFLPAKADREVQDLPPIKFSNVRPTLRYEATPSA
jgi:hypothetical protein